MKTHWLARSALILSILTPVYFMVAALGAKFGLWHWRVGLGTLIVTWGPRLLGAALLLALAALIATLVRRPRRGVGLAILALLIPALGLGYLYQVRARSQTIPPIHDVATNVEDPPVYSQRIAAERTAAKANPVHPLTDKLSAIELYRTPRFAEQASRTVGEIGREAYPDVRPLIVATDRQRLFAALVKAAEDRGWRIVTNDPAGGRLEAVARTFWFGFEDDVAVRVRAAGVGRLTVDARSTSRVGLGDIGANAARLTDYLRSVEADLVGGR